MVKIVIENCVGFGLLVEMNGCGFINGFIMNKSHVQTCELVSHSEKLWTCK